ncbi:hypothetical protein O1611_g6051 [Lasiodiplodia mahajangana]|uniref:Uncharacterized protein n=1 Tax=Lasiodiplodia mahajangana TaxID=1108764 RepID=A0ACC2JJK0_9PEZI|nr:hypothetical protein O1611_g6051 [Lasiodiplodia mahajangana]
MADVLSNDSSTSAKLFSPTESSAREEWSRRKTRGGEENRILDKLMEYEGLERVKQQFLDIKSKVDICKEQKRDLSSERFSIVFQGNPGTGKTTIARLYGEFLESLSVFGVETWNQERISGIEMVNKGPYETEQAIKQIVDDSSEGGVLVIDEAYQLLSPQAGLAGKCALDLVLGMMETYAHKLAIVFVGYREEMESFFEHNPGLSSRIPYVMDFDDFTDYELWKILCKNITDQYHGKMEVEGGMDGLYMRCITRRLSAARGMKGFGNARAAQNLLALVTQSQARRLIKERRDDKKPNCYFLTKEDLIGPNPSAAILMSQAWCELQNLVGLEQVKESVKCLIDSIEINHQRELHEFRPIAFSLNQVFIGEPGTGKTTVARLYGRILADLGYLSRGDVVFKTPADFIGDCLGKSEAQTRRILDASVGKVLIIDEAYMLDPGSSNGDHDVFKTGVIDTIVSMVQGQPFEDRCIILVGYEDKIKTMFRNANPGLSRRFPIEQPFRFNSFTIEQLISILRSKMTDQDLKYSDNALAAACEIFKRDMRGSRTNAGIVDNALEKAKLNYSRRLSKTPFDPQNPNPTFEATDFNLGLTQTARINCRELMKGKIDDTIIDQLEGYQKRHWKAKELDISLEDLDVIPTRFLFPGPPGTGKTTTAHLMAKLFFEMGYLLTPEVVEYSATDFIGQYVGHTGHKTQEKLKDAVGRLVFIDDASRLINGLYETKAVEELTRFLSQPTYQRNIVVVLAGDKESVDKFTESPAVSSVFSEEIAFKNIPPEGCLALLSRELGSNGLAGKAEFTKTLCSQSYDKVIQLFSCMQSTPSWANARDVKHLARHIRGKFFECDNLDIEELEANFEAIIVDYMETKVAEHKARYGESGTGRSSDPRGDQSNINPTLAQWFMETIQNPPPLVATSLSPGLRPVYQTGTDIKVDMSSGAKDNSGHLERSRAEATQARMDTTQPQVQKQKKASGNAASKREEGVSDAVWDQVQRARATASEEQARLQDLEGQLENARAALANGSATDEERLGKEYMAIHTAYEKARNALQGREKIQKALKNLGRCKYGYSWAPVGGGYRCEGGSHFVSDAEIHRLVGSEAIPS